MQKKTPPFQELNSQELSDLVVPSAIKKPGRGLTGRIALHYSLSKPIVTAAQSAKVVELFGQQLYRTLFLSQNKSDYFMLRSTGPFREIESSEYHLGVVVIPEFKARTRKQVSERKQSSYLSSAPVRYHHLALDLCFSRLKNDPRRRTAIFQAIDEKNLLSTLTQYYGGRWQAEMMLNRQKGKYFFMYGAGMAEHLPVVRQKVKCYYDSTDGFTDN